MKLKIITLSFILVILVFLFSSLLVLYDYGFYKTGFIVADSYNNFEDKNYLDKTSVNLVNYFVGKEELFNDYTTDEKSHLLDVKILIDRIAILFFVLVLLFCFILFSFNNSNELWKIFFYSSILIIFICLIFVLVSVFNFGNLFDRFHILLFENGTWMFSEDSLLIRMFPIKFFVYGFVRILGYCLTFSLIFLVTSLYIKR